MKKQQKPITQAILDSTLEAAFSTFTETVFKREINRLDTKIDGVAMSLLMTQRDVASINEKLESMVTKQEVNAIVDRIDYFIGKYKEFDLEQLAQGKHIKELRKTSEPHEGRIVALESSRPT